MIAVDVAHIDGKASYYSQFIGYMKCKSGNENKVENNIKGELLKNKKK